MLPVFLLDIVRLFFCTSKVEDIFRCQCKLIFNIANSFYIIFNPYLIIKWQMVLVFDQQHCSVDSGNIVSLFFFSHDALFFVTCLTCLSDACCFVQKNMRVHLPSLSALISSYKVTIMFFKYICRVPECCSRPSFNSLNHSYLSDSREIHLFMWSTVNLSDSPCSFY